MKGSNLYDNGISGRATSYKVQLKQFYNMKSSLKKKKKKKKKKYPPRLYSQDEKRYRLQTSSIGGATS